MGELGVASQDSTVLDVDWKKGISPLAVLRRVDRDDVLAESATIPVSVKHPAADAALPVSSTTLTRRVVPLGIDLSKEAAYESDRPPTTYHNIHYANCDPG
jgi:hypothetical protein